MKTIGQWPTEYGESHQDHTNKTIHWICVPIIFFTITGMLYSIKLPYWIEGHQVNIALIAMLVLQLYYIKLSPKLWVGLLAFSVCCLFLCHQIERMNIAPLWMICLILFVTAWVGQFYGHHVEGKKPSFFKDLQFLLIGPAWLMSFIYQRLGIKF